MINILYTVKLLTLFSTGLDKTYLYKQENQPSLILKTGRFNNTDSAVIIRSASKAVLMMTAQRYVVKTFSFVVVVFSFLELFSFHIYSNPKIYPLVQYTKLASRVSVLSTGHRHQYIVPIPVSCNLKTDTD